MKRYAEHSCPLPEAKRYHEGFLYACTCGRLWVAREDWHLWDRSTAWHPFEPVRRRWSR